MRGNRFAVIKQRMLEFRTELMPVVNDRGDLVHVYFWNELFAEPHAESTVPLHTPVVIMAGGQGAWLRPITNIIPKPLIPVGDKPIIEENHGSLPRLRCGGVPCIADYKGDMVEHFLAEPKRPYRIAYFREDRPLGTAAASPPARHPTNHIFSCPTATFLWSMTIGRSIGNTATRQ